jgi:hypothetical protein
VSKSLTYVEADVDLYRLTQFEAVRTGLPPAGWSKPWNQNTTLLGVLDAALPSGRGVDFVISGPSTLTVWKWDVVPSIADVSVVAAVQPKNLAADVGVIVRGSGAAGAASGYQFGIVNGGTLQIYKHLASVSTPQGNIAFSYAANELLWLRFDAITVAGPGVLLRGKAWRGALSDEPSAFMVTATDTTSPITVAGATGLFGFTSSGAYFGHFRAKSLNGSLTETLRFARPTAYLPRDIAAVPDLVDAVLTPGTISLGESMGERSTLTVTLQDHRGADLGELYGRGSHFGKLRARALFRRGQAVRVRRGLLGQTLAQLEARHYVFDSFSGPSPQGVATLIAKDPLKLADNDRALTPRPSNGFLVAAIGAADTSATLSPVGIGNAEYAASGQVAIGGKEVCAFTRAGDVLTLTRGQFGTVAIGHNAQDRVQLCLNFNGVDPAVIIHSLLTGYAGIASAQIPLATWQTETATFLQRVYTRLIAEPTGVNKLVSELIAQAGLLLWYDDKLSQLRLQVLRGIAVDAFRYTEQNVLADSLQVQDQPEKQITQVWTYYGVRNPLEPLDQTDNYRSALPTVDLEAEAANGSAVIRTIFGTWIPALARTTAQRVNDLQIGRFVKPPRKLSFDVMKYSGVPEPEPGSGYRIAWWGNQDETGNVLNAPIQVTRVNPMADRTRAEAEEMLFKQFAADDLVNRAIIVDSNFNNVNVRSVHDSIYGAPSAADILAGVNLTVIVSAGVIVGSASVSARAMDIGSWPTTTATGNTTNGSPVITNLSVDPTTMEVGTRVTGAGIPAGAKIASINSPTQITLDKNATATAVGVTLTFHFYVLLRVLGRVQGHGGEGGTAFAESFDGQMGGPALYTRHPVDLDIDQGSLWGGGGGGAGGFFANPFGGGGGAGQLPGAGGLGVPEQNSGQPGTTEAGGAPGGPSGFAAGGGGPGQAGQNSPSAAGGAPGAAIDGVSFIVVTEGPGDIRGPQIG